MYERSWWIRYVGERLIKCRVNTKLVQFYCILVFFITYCMKGGISRGFYYLLLFLSLFKFFTFLSTQVFHGYVVYMDINVLRTRARHDCAKSIRWGTRIAKRFPVYGFISYIGVAPIPDTEQNAIRVYCTFALR